MTIDSKRAFLVSYICITKNRLVAVVNFLETCIAHHLWLLLFFCLKLVLFLLLLGCKFRLSLIELIFSFDIE